MKYVDFLAFPVGLGTVCAEGEDRDVDQLRVKPGDGRFVEAWRVSVEEQKRIEASDSLPFEIYRQQYTSAERLGLSRSAIAPALASV